jgi:hypothetical protein
MSLHKDRITLLLTLVFFCFCVAGQVEALTIAEDGVAKAVIVVAPDSSEPERHAAAELAEFLRQITGGKFEIVYGFVPGKSRIFVGPTAVKPAVPTFSTDGLGSDGIVIRTVGPDLMSRSGLTHLTGTGRCATKATETLKGWMPNAAANIVIKVLYILSFR